MKPYVSPVMTVKTLAETAQMADPSGWNIDVESGTNS